jgi:hypothetical protein
MTAGATGSGLTATLILGALTFKGIDFVKYIVVLLSRASADSDDGKKAKSEATNGLLTLILGCIMGTAIVWSVSKTGFADGITVGTTSLGSLGTGSLVAFGLAMTSVAGVLFDGKKAIDSSDTASKPKLLPDAEKRRQDFVEQSLKT